MSHQSWFRDCLGQALPCDRGGFRLQEGLAFSSFPKFHGILVEIKMSAGYEDSR